uniref:Uncharacterized protein n=1 Tax=Parascaris univalens TaxID=6257 RepID=A0A915BXV7_PARUN
MRTCASDCSFRLLSIIASLLNISAFLQKNDHLTIQTNRFLAQIHEDFIVYGITQDCRVFFVDRSNLDLIKALRVDSRNTYCYPNLVKLHLQQGAHRLALMLIMKQAGNRICTLPIEMPELHTISSGRIFSYSILSSVPYMSCSHLPDNSFALEPDISFMDTAFADVIYFINAKSIGSTWSVRRFQITESGHLRAVDRLSINYPRRDDGIGYVMANQFIVELDLKRSLLYTMNRFLKNLLSECSFDLLFRPQHVQPKWIAFDRDQRRQTWLDSFSIDGDLLFFTESIREESGMTANIYATNLLQPNSTVHILIVNFVADVIVLKKRTIVDLTARNISKFDKSLAQRMLKTALTTSTQTTTTTTTIAPTITSTKPPYAVISKTKTHKPFLERTDYQKLTPTRAYTIFNTSSTIQQTFTTSRTRLMTSTTKSYTTQMAQDSNEDVYYRRETSTRTPIRSSLPSTTTHQTILLPTKNINNSTMARFDHSEKSEQLPPEVEGAMIENSGGQERDAISSSDEHLRRNSFDGHHQFSLEQDYDNKSPPIGDRRLIDQFERVESDSSKGWNEKDKEDEEKQENGREKEEENVYQLPQNIEKDEENVRKILRPTKPSREQIDDPLVSALNDTINIASKISVTNIHIFYISIFSYFLY